MGEKGFPGAEGELMVGGFHSWFCLHFLGSLVSQACVTGPLEKEPSQNVLQHLRKAINPVLMGLLLRNAECQKILSKLSRPEDAPHLWKHHIYHVWLRNYLTPKLSVIDLNITKTCKSSLSSHWQVPWKYGAFFPGSSSPFLGRWSIPACGCREGWLVPLKPSTCPNMKVQSF